MKRVLVAGATGYLGGYVVRELSRRGYPVRALTRNPEKAESLRTYTEDIFLGEITEPETLKGLCDGIDVVFSSVGITRQRDGLSYRDVDFRGNMNLLTEARSAWVKKFIYVSVLNAEELRHLKIIAAKQDFVDELRKATLDHTVIYPNGFFSDMLEVLKMARNGRAAVFGEGEFKGNPIHGEDLARLCVEAVDSEQSEYHVGGPDVLTHLEMIDLACEALGKEKCKVRRYPLWMKNVILALTRAVTPVRVYGPLEFFMTVMSRDMIGECYGQHHMVDFFREHKDDSPAIR